MTEDADAALARDVLQMCAQYAHNHLAGGIALFFPSALSPVGDGGAHLTLSTVTTPALKRAYKQLALRLHPDKNKSPAAGEAFQAMQAIFESCLVHTNANEKKGQLDDEPVPQPPDVFQRDAGGHQPHRTHRRPSHASPPTSPGTPAPDGRRKTSTAWKTAACPPASPPTAPVQTKHERRAARTRRRPADGDEEWFDIPLPPDVFNTTSEEERPAPPERQRTPQASTQLDMDEEIDADALPSFSASASSSCDVDYERSATDHRSGQTKSSERTRREDAKKLRHNLPSLSSSASSASSPPSSCSGSRFAEPTFEVSSVRWTQKGKRGVGPASSAGSRNLRRYDTGVLPSLSQVLAAFDLSLSSLDGSDADGDDEKGTGVLFARTERAYARSAAAVPPPPPPHILSASFTPSLSAAEERAHPSDYFCHGGNASSSISSTVMDATTAAQRRKERASTKAHDEEMSGRRCRGRGITDAKPERCACGRAQKGKCFLCE